MLRLLTCCAIFATGVAPEPPLVGTAVGTAVRIAPTGDGVAEKPPQAPTRAESPWGQALLAPILDHAAPSATFVDSSEDPSLASWACDSSYAFAGSLAAPPTHEAPFAAVVNVEQVSDGFWVVARAR